MIELSRSRGTRLVGCAERLGKGDFTPATLRLAAPILTVAGGKLGQRTNFSCPITGGEVKDPNAEREGHSFVISFRAVANFMSENSELSKVNKVLFSFHAPKLLAMARYGPGVTFRGYHAHVDTTVWA